jgi:hypothetical protein
MQISQPVLPRYRDVWCRDLQSVFQPCFADLPQESAKNNITKQHNEASGKEDSTEPVHSSIKLAQRYGTGLDEEKDDDDRQQSKAAEEPES